MKLIDLLLTELPKHGGWPDGAICANNTNGFLSWDYFGCGKIIRLDETELRIGIESVTKEEYEAALAAKNDGWIKWGGGECPIDKKSLVDLKFRDSVEYKGRDAGDFYWPHVNSISDIIAYRPCKPAEVKTEWNGEVLPPVGTICEARVPVTGMDGWQWRTVKVVESGIKGAEKECLVYDIESTRPSWVDEFRPLRSEADRKRDTAIAKLTNAICGEIPDTGMATAAKYAERVYSSIAAGKIPGVKLEG